MSITGLFYQVNDIHLSNSQASKQNLWTVKYGSLTYIYFWMSIFVPHCSIIPSMTFLGHPSNTLEDIKQNHLTAKYR